MTPTEKKYTIEERKINGVFYTPLFLSDYLSDKILSIYNRNKAKSISVLDPACGDSILLSSLVCKLNHNTNISCYGLDKDTNAVENSTILFKQLYPNIKSNFITTNSLFPLEYDSNIEGWKQLKKKLNQTEGFDIIVSNPPWGADLSTYTDLTDNFELARGQYDIYDLFVETSLINLKNNGIYALILPDSIFSQEQWRLRHLLLTNTTISLIARLGEKIFPEINRACTIIVGINKKPRQNHLINCFHLNSLYRKQILINDISLSEADKDLSHKIPQYRFLKNENYIFDIDFMHSEKKILNKFEHSILPLQEYIQSTRGAEISKKGLVCKCSNCDKWFPYPKNKLMQGPHCDAVLDIELLQKEQIISKHSKTDSKRLKVGEDLYRYTSFSKSYIDVSKNGINYKKINNYNGTKILVRKTGVGITASIDYEDSITNQVVYILKLQPAYINILTLEFVLSVINSRAITYYLIKKYGENEWRTHPYITQTILAKLPFPDLNYSSADNQKIIKKITEIVKREVRNSKEKNISAESDIHIERMIAKLFGLNRDDYESIFQTLNSAEQLIPIKRLTNCNAEQIFKQDGI